MQRFEQPKHASPFISEEEAKEVVKLHVERAGANPGISNGDLAAAIGIQEDEVQRLLAEVRMKRAAEAQIRPMRRHKIRDLIAAFLAACLLLLVGALGLRAIREQAGTSTDYLMVAGTQAFSVPSHVRLVDAEHAENLIDVLLERADQKFQPTASNSWVQPISADNVAQVREGNWDAPGIEHVSVQIKADGFTSSTSLPYSTDPKLSKMCQVERHNRIMWALHGLAMQEDVENR